MALKDMGTKCVDKESREGKDCFSYVKFRNMMWEIIIDYSYLLVTSNPLQLRMGAMVLQYPYIKTVLLNHSIY